MQIPFLSSFLVFGYLVLVAFAVGEWAPTRRFLVRRALFLFTGHVLCLGGAYLSRWFGASALADGFDYASDCFALFTVVQLTGQVVFSLVLPRLGFVVAEIVGDITMGGAYLLAVGFLASNAGVELSSIIATSAVVTAVLGLSLQTTLGNILGGLALQVDNSVGVGDWIRLEDGREGHVVEIHWRHTVVETRNWDTIIVPNATLVAQTVTILGKRTGEPLQHRMWVYFNVDHRYSPLEVIQAVDQALQSAPLAYVAREPAAHCICMELAKPGNESVAQYAVRYWLTDLAKDDPASSSVRVRLYSALQRAGIPLSLPASKLFVTHLDDDRAERKAIEDIDLRMRALDSVELFDPMTPEEKRQLAPRLRRAIFAPGEIIMRQGANAHWFYVLTQGRGDVIRDEGQGPMHVRETEAPSFFGEMGLMTGATREVSVIARTEVECFRIDKDAFHAILAARPEIAEQISQILADREAARVNLTPDHAGTPGAREASAQHRILASMRSFFGLDG